MICHKHRCIFIHIPKNAGQSVESVFLKLLNLTWETRAPLLLRPNDDPKQGPPRLAHLKAREYVSCGHLAARQFDAYFKFAFVRNPWDRAVSLFKYIDLRKGYSFKQFVLERLSKDLWENWHWFVGPQAGFICEPDGHLMVDFLGRFETLHDDFRLVCERLGLPEHHLPHKNRSKGHKLTLRNILARLRELVRTETAFSPRHYTEYYDEETRAIVSELYARDIELFRYQFDRRPDVASLSNCWRTVNSGSLPYSCPRQT